MLVLGVLPYDSALAVLVEPRALDDWRDVHCHGRVGPHWIARQPDQLAERNARQTPFWP